MHSQVMKHPWVCGELQRGRMLSPLPSETDDEEEEAGASADEHAAHPTAGAAAGGGRLLGRPTSGAHACRSSPASLAGVGLVHQRSSLALLLPGTVKEEEEEAGEEAEQGSGQLQAAAADVLASLGASTAAADALPPLRGRRSLPSRTSSLGRSPGPARHSRLQHQGLEQLHPLQWQQQLRSPASPSHK